MTDAPQQTTSGIALTGGRVVPAALLHFVAVRSAGPGGQNVNKTATKVQMRVRLSDLAPILGAEAYDRLQAMTRSRVTTGGELVISCDESRSQHDNRQTCVRRLTALLSSALQRPKRRKRTAPSRSSKRRRLEHKQHHATTKRGRAARHDEW